MPNPEIKKSTGHLSSQAEDTHKLVLRQIKYRRDRKENFMLRPCEQCTPQFQVNFTCVLMHQILKS